MQTLIQLYYKELAEVANFAHDTVENYMGCLKNYFDFAASQLKMDPPQAGAKHLMIWMYPLNNSW